MLVITATSNETRNELNIYAVCSIMSNRRSILLTRTSFFVSSAGKIENVQEFKI